MRRVLVIGSGGAGRPGVLARFAEFEQRGGHVVVLRTPAQVEAFRTAMPTAAAARPGAVSIDGTVSEERKRHGL